MTARIDRDAFFHDMRYEPHPGQQRVHASTARRRVLACGVRWGKTRCAAMEGIVAAMDPSPLSRGWVVAPTYELADKVFREIVIIATEHLRHRIVTMRESDRRLVLTNMSGGKSEIRAKSADNPVSLLGEGLDWLIADEAARLKPSIWDSHLSQRLVDKKGWALLISTPKGKGWFYDAFRHGQGIDSDFESWNEPSRNNPHLDAEWIERERARIPHRVFAQEYEGEFIEGAGAVFRNVRECATGDLSDPVPGEYYHGGLDLAKVEDYTVFVIMNSAQEVVFVDRFHRLDWSTQVARIHAAAQRYNECQIRVDSTGVGDPIFESLRLAGCECEGYTFTMRSKAALVDNLSLLLEQRQITLPNKREWPVGIDELESFQYSISDAGNAKTSAPGGMHDDCVMALGLAAWSFRPQEERLLVIEEIY